MGSVASVILAHVALVLPGWLIARLLGSPLAVWLAAPIGQLMLMSVVLAVHALGLPLTFGSVLAAECGLIAILGGALAWRKPAVEPLPPPIEEVAKGSPAVWWLKVGMVCTIVVVGAVFVIRSTVSPLTGSDVPFRWALLAEQMLAHRTLSFYPPMSPADFAIYFHPDGIPPLVSAGHWWAWAAWGKANWSLSAPLLTMQYASLVGLLWHIGRRLGGAAVAAVTVMLAGASFETFASMTFGQESGLQVISVVAMVAVLLVSRRGDARAAMLLGVIAAIGITSREYGWAWLVIGVGMMAAQRWTWRQVAIFAGVAVAMGAPWYLRNFMRTGSPFYTLTVGPFVGVNPVYNELMQAYRDRFALARLTWSQRLAPLQEPALMLALQMTVGLVGSVIYWRRLAAAWVAYAVITGLWLASVAYTAGGLGYSLRVTTPVGVLLAAPAALVAARLLAWTWSRRTVMVVLAAYVLHSACTAAAYPLFVPNPIEAVGFLFTPIDRGMGDEALVAGIKRLIPPRSRILAENAYIHALLANSDWELVPIWSPEVAFLFDHQMPEPAVRRRLLELRIEYALLNTTSANMIALDRYPIMQEAPNKWDLLGRDGKGMFLLRVLPP